MNTTIITDKIVFGGKCIGKNGGKTVFVPFSVPGERLEVEIVRSRRDYDEARVVRIEEPSPYRVTPPCALYGKCGGCDMMHIAPDRQALLRAEMLRDCFARCGVSAPEIIPIRGPDFHYRCRFQLHGGGLFERAGNAPVFPESCAVAEDAVNEWLAAVPAEERPAGRCHLFGSGRASCSWDPAFPHVAAAEGAENEKAAPSGRGAERRKTRAAKKRYAGTVISPAQTVTAEILDKKISFDVRGFFQSNLFVLEKAIRALCDGLAGKDALDLYAGCGTFSVFLADLFESVTLVEHNRDALVFAEMNLAGKRHESYGIGAEKWIETAAGRRFDAAVVDPPRSGMAREVTDFLCRARVPVIRSLSCDPATHARDAARLIRAGYRLERLYLLDFYPHTSHIESLAWFCL